MEIKDNLTELIDQLNSNNLPIDNTEYDFSICLPLILNQFPNHCKPPSEEIKLDNDFKLTNNNLELIGWNLESLIYKVLYNLNSFDYYDYSVKSEEKLVNEDLISYWENLAEIEIFLNGNKYEEAIKLLIETIHLIPVGSPSSIIDDNASIGQNIDRLKNILNSAETTKLVGILLSLIYLQLGMTNIKFSLDNFISFFNLIQLNLTSLTVFISNIISEWAEFISITLKYGIDSCFNPQLTQYAVKVLIQSLKLQPHRKIEFLRLIKSTPFMADEILRLQNDNPSQLADYWNSLLLDPQSLISSINRSNNNQPNPMGWNLLFWENFAPTASSNSSINLMKIDSLLRCTLGYQKHVGGLFTEPFNAHTKVIANIYKALAPSPYPERVYCSTLAFLLVNLTFRFPNHNQYIKHLLEKFYQIFPYGVSYLLGMVFRLPDSWEQLKKDLNGWMGVNYPINSMDPHQLNAIKDHFLTEGIYPKRAKEILLSLPYNYYQPKENRILVFGQPTDYCLESMILLHVNCKEYLNCDKWILNMITKIPKFPIPPHCFRLIDVYIQRVANKLSPKILESSLKLHLSDCYPHKPILPKHILLSYYYIKYYNCLVPEINCINPDITDLSYSHQILDNIPLTEISKKFQYQSKFGLESYYYNYKGLLAQFFKYTINSQNSFNRNFELNGYRKPIGVYPIEREAVPISKSLYPSLIVQGVLKDSKLTNLMYQFLLNTPSTPKLFKYAKSIVEFGIKDCLTNNFSNAQLEYNFLKIWKKLHLKLPNLVWNWTLQGCSLVQLDTNHQLNNLVNLESLMTDVMMSFRLPSKIYMSKYLVQIPLTMALCSLLGWKEKLLMSYLIKPAEFRNGMGFDGFNAAIVSEYTWLLQTLIELMNPKKLTDLPEDFNSINLEIMKACDTLLLESGNLVKSLLRQGFDIDMIPYILNNLPAARAAIKEYEFSKVTIEALIKGSDCQKWFGICLAANLSKFVESETWGAVFINEFIEIIKKITSQYFEKLPFHNFTLKQYITPSQVKQTLLLIAKNYPNCKTDIDTLINSLPFDSSISESNNTLSLATTTTNNNQLTSYNSKFQYAYLSWKVTQLMSPQTTSPSNKAARPTTPTNNPHLSSNRGNGGGEFSNDDYHYGKRGSTSIDHDDFHPLPSKLSNMGGGYKKHKRDGGGSGTDNSYRPSTSQNYTKPQRANSSNLSNNPRGSKSPNNLGSNSNNIRPNNPQYHGQHGQNQVFRDNNASGGRIQQGGGSNRPPPGRNNPGSGPYTSNNRGGDNDDRFNHSNSRPRGKGFPRGGGGGGSNRGRSAGGGGNRRASNVE